MKKIIFGTALSLFALVSTTSISAQDIAGGIIIRQNNSRVVDPESKREYKVVNVTEVNVRAARDFGKSFRTAQDVAWVQSKNGTSVYFTYGGHKMRSTYDRNGNREYTLTYYNESTMPGTLRHLVKRNYYDYTIEQITEVKRNEMTSYLVKMQNSKELLTVKVVDGEITPFEHISKAN